MIDIWTWAAACWMGIDLETAERVTKMRKAREVRALIQQLERWLHRRKVRGSTNNSDLVTAIVLLEEYETLLIERTAS